MSSSPFNPLEQEANDNFVVRVFPRRFSRATSRDQYTYEHEVEAPSNVIAITDGEQKSSENSNNNTAPEEDVTHTESPSLTLILRPSSKLIDMQPHTNAHMTRLPAELLNKIFSALNRADSVCLGLASYNLYLAYRSFHPTGTDLWAPNRLSKNPLHHRLRGFMGERYVYYESRRIFVTRDRFAELGERERRVDEEDSELSDDSLDWMSPRTLRRITRFWFPDFSDDEDE